MSIQAQYRPRTTNPNAPWLNGSVPTSVTRSTTFELRYFDGNGTPAPVDTYVIKRKRKLKHKYYILHYMATFAGTYGQEALLRELRHIKDKQKANGLWIHMEDGDLIVKDGNTLSNVQKVVQGCEIVGLEFAIGLKHGGAWGHVWQALDLTINSPMGMKDVDGRPVLLDYHLFAGNYWNVVKQVETRDGWTMDDIVYIPEMQFPMVQSGSADVGRAGINDENGNPTGQAYPEWSEDSPYPTFAGFGAPQDKTMVNYLFDNFPEVAGLMGWQGENVKTDGMIANAKSILDAASESGRIAAVAWVLRYASDTGYTDVGFAGGLKFFQWITSMSPQERPDIIDGITANDFAESTGHDLLPSAWPLRGLGGVLPLNPGYGNGNKIRHPDVENYGIDEAFAPFIECFLNDTVAPVVTEDKIFYKVTLHPANVKPRPNSPLLYKNHDGFYNAAYQYSMYASPYSVTTTAIGLYNMNNVAEVFIHSKAPVQGEINGVRSEIMPAGFNTFSTDIGEYIGSVQFRSLVSGRQKINAYSEQPRLNDIFPHAGKPMILEGNPNGKTYPAAPKLKKVAGKVVATVSSKLPIVYRLDHDLPKPYTAPVEIPEGLTAWFYTEETDKYNESPVTVI